MYVLMNFSFFPFSFFFLNMESSVKNRKEVCIIYHFPCYDGTYGAINAYLYYKNFTNDKYNITFKPLRNIFPIFSIIDKNYDKIISLDLALKDEDMNFLTDKKNDNISIVLFDHHFSWYERYTKDYIPKIIGRKKLKIFFDEKSKKSACGLSFDYFKEKALSKKDINKELVSKIFNDNYKIINDYIEDSDTGNFSLKFIHEFKSGLSNDYPLHLTDFTSQPKNIKKFIEICPSYLTKIGEKSLSKLKRQAKSILKQNNIYVVELKGGYKFLMCITEKKYVRNYACPLLGKISKKRGYLPVGAFVYEYVNNLYKFSMRASDDTCDVSKIANVYGGGGHKAAAAFTMDYDGIDNLILKTINIKKDIDRTQF